MKNKAKSRRSMVGISERKLEDAKQLDLPTINHEERHKELTDAVVSNNLQSRYHAK